MSPKVVVELVESIRDVDRISQVLYSGVFLAKRISCRCTIEETRYRYQEARYFDPRLTNGGQFHPAYLDMKKASLCVILVFQRVFRISRCSFHLIDRCRSHSIMYYAYLIIPVSCDCLRLANRRPTVQLTVLEKWCRGRESNPYGGHPPQDFKSCASASSATPAFCLDASNGGP